MANENTEIQDLSTEEITDKATDFFEANKSIIYGLAGLVVVVIVGFYWYKFQYQAPREISADDELFKAEQMMERDSFELALNGRDVLGQEGSSFIGFSGIIAQYSGTEAANIAHYKAGAALLRMDKPELALEYLKEYSGPSELQAQAYSLMGDAASMTSDFAAALGYYDDAAGATDNTSLQVYYYYKAGRLQEHQNKPAEAVKYFQKIADKDLKVAEALGVDKDLIRLTQ